MNSTSELIEAAIGPPLVVNHTGGGAGYPSTEWNVNLGFLDTGAIEHDCFALNTVVNLTPSSSVPELNVFNLKQLTNTGASAFDKVNMLKIDSDVSGLAKKRYGIDEDGGLLRFVGTVVQQNLTPTQLVPGLVQINKELSVSPPNTVGAMSEFASLRVDPSTITCDIAGLVIDDAATLRVNGPPVAGANTVVGVTSSFKVDNGTSLFLGDVDIDSPGVFRIKGSAAGPYIKRTISTTTPSPLTSIVVQYDTVAEAKDPDVVYGAWHTSYGQEVTKAGVYLVSATFTRSGLSSYEQLVLIQVRTSAGATVCTVGDTYTKDSLMSVQGVVTLNAGDYVSVVANFSGAVTVIAGFGYYMTISRLVSYDS
jgi:hypothetical protein